MNRNYNHILIENESRMILTLSLELQLYVSDRAAVRMKSFDLYLPPYVLHLYAANKFIFGVMVSSSTFSMCPLHGQVVFCFQQWLSSCHKDQIGPTRVLDQCSSSRVTMSLSVHRVSVDFVSLYVLHVLCSFQLHTVKLTEPSETLKAWITVLSPFFNPLENLANQISQKG